VQQRKRQGIVMMRPPRGSGSARDGRLSPVHVTRIVVASLAAVALAALGSLPGPVRAASTPTATYIPRPPMTDTLLYPPPRKDRRIIPGHMYPLGMDDPHVPSSAHSIWHNQNYFSIPYVAEAARLIPIVENGHLGLKTNPRGFWPHFNARRYPEAIGELKYVLGVFVNHPRALHLLGIHHGVINGLPEKRQTDSERESHQK